MSCVTVFPKWKSRVCVPLPQPVTNALRNTDAFICACGRAYTHMHARVRKAEDTLKQRTKIRPTSVSEPEGWLLEGHLKMRPCLAPQWLACPHVPCIPDSGLFSCLYPVSLNHCTYAQYKTLPSAFYYFLLLSMWGLKSPFWCGSKEDLERQLLNHWLSLIIKIDYAVL